MRTVLAMGLATLVGCDSVFGLTSPDDPTDEDPRVDAMGPDAASCEGQASVMVAAVEDAYLEAPASRHGARSLLIVDSGRTVIVKFPIVDEVPITNATLRLAHPAMTRGCSTGGTACEPCAAGTSGTISVTWLRPDWNEQATSTERDDSGREWSGEHASGMLDRGTTAVTASYTAGSGLEITIARAASDQRAEWAAATTIALRLATTTAGAIFASREAGDDDACGVVEPPTLFYGCR